MKRIVLGIAAAISLLATNAMGADLAARPYVKAPPMVAAVYNWTGFYVGGNIGYSWGRSRDDSTLTTPAGVALFASSDRANMDGVIGGGQIGYNWQTQNWVWGLEADIQGSDQKGSRAFTCPTGVCTPPFGVLFVAPGPAVPVTLDQKLSWFGTVRGRVGILATPTVLFYGTGGLAYGEVKTTETIGAAAAVFSNSDVRVGYTVGAGVEGVISGNWTAKLEYLWMDLGRTRGSFTTAIGALGGGVLTSNYSSRITDNILRVGVNYKFGGPVVAKY
ncbi:outer membrane protein [Bradyrhizobium iriomotense]|uniref:outer membrane protein n=1 Tax=Bradyrhizobium iriomotense TaxID=441950 RepID=UPI001B8A2788|nr:outer membrane protein [Bradyrhizobium iriomotense]MBR0780533.1 porin family protein [Bradyrhizobium iriomotense]